MKAADTKKESDSPFAPGRKEKNIRVSATSVSHLTPSTIGTAKLHHRALLKDRSARR
jgi:hypothetical protein